MQIIGNILSVFVSLEILLILGLLGGRWIIGQKRKGRDIYVKIIFTIGIGVFVSGLTILHQTNFKDWIMLAVGVYVLMVWAFTDSVA